jgi:glycosyltransferase involved in cell wall biosynthesis
VNRPVVVILGPNRAAVSGVSTHLNLLLDSSLAEDFEMVHFQVGSEGRGEGPVGRLLRLLASPFAFFATILFRHAAVVHINTSLNTRAYWRDLAYLWIAKLLRARVLYQVHGGALPQHFFKSRLMQSFLRWTLNTPDVVVLLAEVELQAYRRFVPEQYVVLMPNGIDCRPYAQVPTVRSRAEYPLRLLYIGRIAREKGLYETFQGLRLAHELGIDARLVVAGAGPEEPRLRRYAQALGIDGRITFAGPVFGEDKVKLFAGADVMLLPSYSEGLPYALLEAMAAGIPVIATPVGAIPDVMAHGTHGFLVPVRDGKALAEAIAALGANREQLSWMSRACRRRIRAAYDIDRLAREFALRYAELCGDLMVAAGPTVAAPPRKAAPAAQNRPADIAGGD